MRTIRKKILGIICFLFLPLLLSGCLGRLDYSKFESNITDSQNGQAATTGADQLAETEQKIPKEKTYYPEQPAAANAGSGDQDRSFTISSQLLAKLYLVDKYQPGICFGQPLSQTASDISALISQNQVLAKFIKLHYRLESDSDVYKKIKQLQGVTLTPIESSKYEYQFSDGQCCSLTTYQGMVELQNNNASDEIKNKSTKLTPC